MISKCLRLPSVDYDIAGLAAQVQWVNSVRDKFVVLSEVGACIPKLREFFTARISLWVIVKYITTEITLDIGV